MAPVTEQMEHGGGELAPGQGGREAGWAQGQGLTWTQLVRGTCQVHPKGSGQSGCCSQMGWEVTGMAEHPAAGEMGVGWGGGGLEEEEEEGQ